jgi:ferredoxin
MQETGAGFVPFSASVKVATKTGTFQQLEMAQDILDADVIINLPKLKTHQMMGMTCGVKNLFGAVVGIRKPRLHLQTGVSKEYFALMLLELAEFINPALTIVDAVVGMEGDGPGSGDPVQIGALLAGTNDLAVDSVACELLGLKPDSVWTQRVARKTNRPGANLDEIEIIGAAPVSLRPASFRPAHSSDVNFRLPGFLKKPLRRSLTARPEVSDTKCIRCGICVEACPPQIMTIENNRLQIGDKGCIRCFCCQELCPEGAILTRQGVLLRLSQFLTRSKKT